jgi:hypothetical protein
MDTSLHSSSRSFRHLALIIGGLVLGVALGLALGWLVWPIQYTEADPALLREEYRQDYVIMIATAYAGDGDLTAARQRLAHLGENDQDYLLDLTAELVASGQDESIIQSLARLSADLGLTSPSP